MAAVPRFALWNLGFRPFYLLASVFAALSTALWAAQFAGVLPESIQRSSAFHAHEMLFGYAVAVIAGFLLTAVRTWTNRPTPSGPMLAALAALWIAGRVLVQTPCGLVGAVVDAAFPAAVAVAIGIPLVQSGNRRNYFFIALLVLLGLADIATNLSQLGIVSWPTHGALQAGLDLVLFIMAVVGGRVIPMFTNNGIPGARATRNTWVERLALGGVLALLGADAVQAPAVVIVVLALALSLVHAARLALWQPWRTGATPLVWILHASYGWIVVHLALRALAAAGLVAAPLAIHALTIGAIGGMTLGMMTRTARGHTGRPLAADGFEVACFVLVQLAASIRVVGGMLLPDVHAATIVVSGICLSAAFAVYAIRYWPVLSRPRVDGKPG